MKQFLTDLAAGKAGEYLVCADLILKGHVAFPSEQGLPYDVIAQINGRLYKIQVKTTRGPRPVPQRKEYIPAYLFHIRCGKGGIKQYGNDDVDIFALVALDTKCISYIPASDIRSTMIFRSPALRGQYKNEIDMQNAILVKENTTKGMSGRGIAKLTGLDPSTVSRIRKRKRLSKGHRSSYLDEYTFEKAFGL
jgi:hypothetical protein